MSGLDVATTHSIHTCTRAGGEFAFSTEYIVFCGFCGLPFFGWIDDVECGCWLLLVGIQSRSEYMTIRLIVIFGHSLCTNCECFTVVIVS